MNCNSETEEETIAVNKKRARRVSFAENTSVHIFDRDEESESPSFFRPMESPSSGSAFGSATSNDVAGASLKEVLDTSNMISQRALLLLAQRGEAAAAKRPNEPEREKDDGVEVVDVDKERESSVGEVAAEVHPPKKKHRVDKDGHHSRRNHASRHGARETLGETVVGANQLPGGQLRGVVLGTSGERDGPIMIEIGAEARWNLGDQQPLQAFRAFHLANDAGLYAGFSRDEVIMWSRRRLGMFISDYERIVGDLETELKAGFNREILDLKKNLSEANRKLCDTDARKVEAAKKLESLEKEVAEEKLLMEKKLRDTDEEMERLRSDREEYRRARDAASASNVSLVQEVAALKDSLAKSDEELIQSLEAGYNLCYSQVEASGGNVTGHSFEEYCAELTKNPAAGAGVAEEQ